ncbi:MAG: DUF3458 domain-containing protein, partial [Pseudomonadota bacterium]
PDTPGQTGKSPHVIPLALGLLGSDGTEMTEPQVLELSAARQSVRFDGLPERPVPSLNRGFSAPVTLERETDDAERAFLLAHDSDPFNRYEAGRLLGLRIARAVIGGDAVPATWTGALENLLADQALDPAFKAIALDAPGADEVGADLAGDGIPVDPDAIHSAVTAMRLALGQALAEPLRATYDAMQVPGPYSPDADSAGRRALQNRCLSLLSAAGESGLALADAQLAAADNMSLALPALKELVNHRAPTAGAHVAAFHEKWQADTLVVDKWLSLQATAPGAETLAAVEALTAHSSFDWTNPNKFRSLIGAFAMANPTGFHQPSGAGYRFFTDWLIKLDALNPQTTARLAGAFETWRRFTPDRRALMKAEMDRMVGLPSLSKNTREIVERILAA